MITDFTSLLGRTKRWSTSNSLPLSKDSLYAFATSFLVLGWSQSCISETMAIYRCFYWTETDDTSAAKGSSHCWSYQRSSFPSWQDFVLLGRLLFRLFRFDCIRSLFPVNSGIDLSWQEILCPAFTQRIPKKNLCLRLILLIGKWGILHESFWKSKKQKNRAIEVKHDDVTGCSRGTFLPSARVYLWCRVKFSIPEFPCNPKEEYIFIKVFY